jgi:antitoxin ParD1/3/4
MASSYSLGAHFEAFVKAQLASGRYGNASEVLRDALRLMEERGKKLAAFDAAIMRGIADIEAGRVYDAEDVFDELLADLKALPEQAAESNLSSPRRRAAGYVKLVFLLGATIRRGQRLSLWSCRKKRWRWVARHSHIPPFPDWNITACVGAAMETI